MVEKIAQIVIDVKDARAAFLRVHKAEARKDPKTGEPRGKAKFSGTLLLDPTRQDHAASIKAIKADAKRILDLRYGVGTWPKANPATGMGGLIMCFGNGNDLDKIYDGYKDMFYVKLSDTNRPLLGNRAGKVVVEGDPQCPYSGCYVNARISLWSYDNESRGINSNFRSMQFVRDGDAFGGGGNRSAEEEFAALGDSAGVEEKDPFDLAA